MSSASKLKLGSSGGSGGAGGSPSSTMTLSRNTLLEAWSGTSPATLAPNLSTAVSPVAVNGHPKGSALLPPATGMHTLRLPCLASGQRR
eukprot:1821455-Rhodomonas_salina.1